MPRFTRDTKIADILDAAPEAGEVLRKEFGLPCEECVVQDFETLAEGAELTAKDVDRILARLNELPRRPPDAAEEGET